MIEKIHCMQRHVHTYNCGRSALIRLGYGKDWQPITKDDLCLSADISEANRTGQNRHKLPWFWSIDGDRAGRQDIEDSDQMKECECFLPIPLIAQLFAVYRINWLRAKAQVSRWEEEAWLVPNEMDWTVKQSKKMGQPGRSIHGSTSSSIWLPAGLAMDLFCRPSQDLFRVGQVHL